MIYIDLPSQEPRPDLFTEVWGTSIDFLAPPSAAFFLLKLWNSQTFYQSQWGIFHYSKGAP